ncbi:MAG: glycosyltransferase family 4 protein [Kineosporiaceae bacterium]|nr:glycosyltransferase family 4 protein [Kineosporiaceae bacterium]
MRIAVLCSDLGVRIPGDKGASMHLSAITAAFAALGHEVMLIGVAGHGEPPTELAGVHRLLLPHPGRSEGIERERRKLAFTDHLHDVALPELTRFGPELIYERLALFGTAGTRSARRLGVPHVVEVNALLAREEAAWRGLHHTGEATRREVEVLAAADLRVTVSQEWRRAVRDLVGDLATVTVPNGVDAATFRSLPTRGAARADWGLPQTGALAGFVGALRGWHGVEVAIDALARTRRPVELVVAGDGDLRASLAERAVRAGVAERVHWLGHVAHHRVPSLLAALDLALAPYPSRDFAFSPLKLYEYLAAGVPVVASDVGQVHDVLQAAGCGVLVEPGRADALAAGIDRALDGRAGLRRRAAAARHRALVEHAWPRRAADILSALAQLRPQARAHAVEGVRQDALAG